MPGQRDYTFVLWADNFEEVAATVFVTELREAGLRVKIVGLTGQRSRGMHGLALVPDLTLDQALPLASRARCLVLPCAAPSFRILKNDPRLHQFFNQIRLVQARFVISPAYPTDQFGLDLLPLLMPERLLVYPDNQEMVKFARELTGLLEAE